MSLKASHFSSDRFNGLNSDIAYVTDWALREEQLAGDLDRYQRELRDLNTYRPASNEATLKALQDALGMGPNAEELLQRQNLLKPIVEDFRQSLAANSAIRATVQGRHIGRLRRLYLTESVDALAADFNAVAGADGTAETDKQIKALEKRITALQADLEKHRSGVLQCFRGGVLPKHYRGAAVHLAFERHENTPQTELGLLIVKDFLREWRGLAGFFVEPVSCHGTSIASMNPERRSAWAKAFLKLHLVPNVKPLFVAHIEPGGRSWHPAQGSWHEALKGWSKWRPTNKPETISV